jgi:hypothetical protein
MEMVIAGNALQPWKVLEVIWEWFDVWSLILYDGSNNE